MPSHRNTSFFLHPLKFGPLPFLASEPVCPDGGYASYLLGPSSDRDLNDYLVELFVDRLFAGQEVKQEQLWFAYDGL